MGDTGSLPMGGTIALIAIFLKQEVLLVIAGGMFVLETVSVLIQRLYFKWTKHTQGTGKRIFLMAPIHHHFEKKGWMETQVVIRFWIVAALCALASLAFLKIR
ncbi:MAG: phospho-N-acetylmuramoyl-pentapeptide-transferase, partial [Brevinematales bacterium]